jgi:type IV pilus assembly protein PilE
MQRIRHRPAYTRTRRRSAGITLVETALVVAIVGLTATMAFPSFQQQLAQARRAEAAAAIQRLQLAQESFAAHHGAYALRLESLHGLGERPRYHRLTLQTSGHSSYAVQAESLTNSEDRCASLTLHVREGKASYGPEAACWP